MKKFLSVLFYLLASAWQTASAQEITCISTTWRLINNDKVCVHSFQDPDIKGVVCHLSFARTGGVSGALGIAENPSRFSISCNQNGPISSSKGIALKKEKIFTQKMSFLFKDLNVVRIIDIVNNSILYLVISEKIIDGSPFNSLSSVPIMPWGNQAPLIQFNK